MKKSRMNIGIVGCGGFVQGNHLPNAAQNPNLKIRALCDINKNILQTLGDKYAVDYVTADYHDLARDNEIEMVIIGTTPALRVGPIKALAEKGKHIYVEKPMSLGYEDSKEIVDIIKNTGVKFQVGFNRPYSGIMREAKRIFKKMRKGPTLIYYRIVGESRLWPKFHQDDVASGRSITIIHETTHIFNLLNWLMDQEPVRVYTVGGKSDDHVITFTYPDDAVATIVSGSCGTEAYPKERMEVFSDYKVLVMDDFVELECTQIPEEKDQVFPLKSNPVRNRKDGLSWKQLREDLMRWRKKLTEEDIRKGYYYTTRPCVEKGHYAALQALYDSIRDNTPALTDAYHGAVATLVGLKAVESLQSGKPVDLNFSFLKSGQ